MADNKTLIKYYGHDLFAIKASSGLQIITDPFNEWVKPDLPTVDADVVLISHDHDDHNNLGIVKNYKKVIKGFGEFKYQDLIFKGIKTFHDEAGGELRGLNTMFLFTVDGMTFLHTGDIGTIPDSTMLNKLKKVDVLFVPVGGGPTIDAAQAIKLINIIKPKIAIPMHFKISESASIPFTYVDRFLELIGDYKEFSESIEISAGGLPPSTQVWYIKPIE